MLLFARQSSFTDLLKVAVQVMHGRCLIANAQDQLSRLPWWNVFTAWWDAEANAEHPQNLEAHQRLFRETAQNSVLPCWHLVHPMNVSKVACCRLLPLA